MHLPDINFWLALAFQSHTHHKSAEAWMQSAPEQSCFFCRLTQQGFLRLVTNHRIFHTDAVSMREAWELYDRMRLDVRVGFVDEPDDVEVAWRAFTQSTLMSTNVWADAYLAAFAHLVGFEIITFDRGFTQYTDVQKKILS